jgi:hypothetical protein
MAIIDTLDLQGFCYQDLQGGLPSINMACTDSGGWILDRNTVATNVVELNIEIQLRAILELYANLVANGVELTRNAHATLTDLCTCMHHLAFTDDTNQILSLRLKLNFLEDVTLQSLLMTGSAAS